MSTDSTTSTPYTSPFLSTSTPFTSLSISTPWDYGMVVFTVLIAIFGTAANSLSLSYFVNVVRFSGGMRNAGGSTTQLFAKLNFFDLLVSLTSAFEFILWYYPFIAVLEVFKTICMISMVMTGFLTCVLAVVRMIHLLFPLYNINWRAVTVSIVLYSMTVLVLVVLFFLRIFIISDESLLHEVLPAVDFSILAGVFLIDVLVNIISLVTLYFSKSSHRESRDIKRRATITVMIISVIFCICSIGLIVIYVANIFYNYVMPFELIEISLYILVPLNSACNPMVYLMRKEEMRSHVRTLWGRLAGYMCRKEEQDITGVDNGARCDTRATAV